MNKWTTAEIEYCQFNDEPGFWNGDTWYELSGFLRAPKHMDFDGYLTLTNTGGIVIRLGEAGDSLEYQFRY
jgi:hypothetical protein